GRCNVLLSRRIYKGMSMDALPLSDPALLPDDPAVLKQLVVQLLEELRQAHARLERQEHHMHLLLKRLGARARSTTRYRACCSIWARGSRKLRPPRSPNRLPRRHFPKPRNATGTCGLGVMPRNLFFLAVVLAHGFRRLAPPY
ncbi:MAG TPA: hypothetical protein VJL29_02245, partial [Thermoguttaceae bacterium]|nr:hypothetical protein [Thermoguttaceae bacterium]